MSKIEDPRHQSYVKHSLVDILIIIMCGVLSGLDTLGDLVIYAKSKQEFLSNVLEVRQIPSKATFARVLNPVDGKKIGEAILDILRERFGTAGEVIAVDGMIPRNVLWRWHGSIGKSNQCTGFWM